MKRTCDKNKKSREGTVWLKLRKKKNRQGSIQVYNEKEGFWR